jgi:hypothetical protein
MCIRTGSSITVACRGEIRCLQNFGLAFSWEDTLKRLLNVDVRIILNCMFKNWTLG